MQELLSNKLRPQKLDDVIGQKHLIGENKVLTNLVKNNKLFSMILYGPPGIGKTSIANALSNEVNMHIRCLNATINNKKDFEVVVNEAKMYDGIVLIMDEIHRLNKDKQDLLLPYLESGLITLIGLTTSNPYHAINPAIRSRCVIYELKPLNDDDINDAIDKLLKKNILKDLIIDDDARKLIINTSNCDLRYVYNIIEIAYYSITNHHLTASNLKKINIHNQVFIDKNGDYYYHIISAFQKSIRGSDVHAALYYLGVFLESGDIETIARRLSVIVYEDIGLANSILGVKLDAAINAALRVGMPEARIPLSTIVIEMALSPKSNSAEMAINKVINDIETKKIGDIPPHIINHSPLYKYPHDYKNSYVKQQYLPDEIKHEKYYIPKDNRQEQIYKTIMDNLYK